jgi:hypothetical protein
MAHAHILACLEIQEAGLHLHVEIQQAAQIPGHWEIQQAALGRQSCAVAGQSCLDPSAIEMPNQMDDFLAVHQMASGLQAFHYLA